MKTTTLTKSAVAGLTALVIGSATAQESVSKPVGYETIDYVAGFNYLGIRLHEAPVSSGETADVAGSTITVADGVADALAEGETYIFEVSSGDAVGGISVIDSFDADGDTLVLVDDLSANLVTGDSFTIRPASSLETVFGPAESDTLAAAAAPGQADQVWVPNATGGFDKYYKYSFFGSAEWRNVDTDAVVDPAAVDLIYTDAIILQALAADSLVVSGSVKLDDTGIVLADGFNYVGSVYPVGANLDSFFGPLDFSFLDAAAAAGQADQIWIPDGAGFVKYYPYSFFGTTNWRNVDTDTNVDDPTTVELSSGFIIQNVGGPSEVIGSAPSFYADL